MKIAFRRYSRFLFLFYLDIVVIILLPILFVCFPNDFDVADENTLVIVYFYPAFFIPIFVFIRKKAFSKIYFTEYGIYDKSRNIFLEYEQIEGFRQTKIHNPRSRNGLMIISLIYIKDYSHKHSITIEMTSGRYKKLMKSNIIPDCAFKKELWGWYSGWFGSFDD